MTGSGFRDFDDDTIDLPDDEPPDDPGIAEFNFGTFPLDDWCGEEVER